MPEFNYLPSVPVLQALVGTSLAGNLNTVSKAVRLWYTIKELVSEFQSRQFTDREWREHLYQEFSPGDRDRKPDKKAIICNQKIKNILFKQQLEDNWGEWKESFISFYLDINIKGRSRQELENYLKILDTEKPFYVTGKTILNDLKKLVSRGYLECMDSGFNLVDEFPQLQIYQPSSPQPEITPLLETEITTELPGDFRSFTDLFWQQPNDIQRFYLHTDYQTLPDTERRVAQYRKKLREIWKNGSGIPCQLTYQSSSQKQTYAAVVYPVCIYYYQRSFYLCAFGRKKDEIEVKSNWYNYRLDHIQALECLEWDNDSIPPDLLEKCQGVDDDELIYEIEMGVEDAYGFDIDIYRSSKLMLLRFERDFHDRYIENTWRHQTFKKVKREQISNLMLKSGAGKSEIALIIQRIENHPQNAVYYRMNYRDGDNSVIMRLRAWCPNVEVLFPLDLRQRMRNDMKKTWALYSEDE